MKAMSAALAVLACVAASACAAPGPPPASLPSTQFASAQAPTPSRSTPGRVSDQASAASMLPALVGIWTQSEDIGLTARARRTYAFAPDGSYEFSQRFCQSFEQDCTGGAEHGFVVVGPETLTFIPVTGSAEGERTYVFAITPELTELWLQRSDGGIEIFFRR